MKILFLPNWNVQFLQTDNPLIQAPDKYVKGQPYWFFRYIQHITRLDIINIGRKSLFQRLEKKLHFYLLQSIKAFMCRNSYDVVISHGAPSAIFYEFLTSFVRRKPRHIIFDIGSLNSGGTGKLMISLLSFALRKKPILIAHASEQLVYYRRYYPALSENAYFIPFGVDCAYFEHCIQQFSLQPKKESDYLLCFGFLDRDYDTLLKAWKMIQSDKILRIVGNPQLQIPNGVTHVELLDKMPFGELLQQIYSSSFVVIPLPDYRFSLGQMSFLQSMSMGKPVVVTNMFASRDYILHAPGAIAVKPYDLFDMKQALERFLNLSQSELDLLGEENKRYVETHFDEHSLADSLSNLL